MAGSSPVPLSLADALVGMQVEDPRTPKKINLSDSEDGNCEPDGSPGSVATTAAVASEDAQSTPQKIELAAEVPEFTPCGAPPGLPEFSAALDGTPCGGMLSTSPLPDLSACGLPYFEACGMDPSMLGAPTAGLTPCSPYALFGPEFFPEMVAPSAGDPEQFMSLFQGLIHGAPPTAVPAGTADEFQLLATMADETADPILAALAATSPLKKKEPEGDPAAGKLDAPPGLPLPSRPKLGSEAPPGLAGWASDDSTASPASDGTDAPSTSSRSDQPLGSPASDSFTMSPEALPFVPSFAGLVTAPLDPLAVLATAPPAPVPAVEFKDGEKEGEEEEAKHGAGNCRPCAWFWKEVGCSSGKDCEYCHECPKGALKARKKVKRAMIRLGQATSPGAQEALAPAPGSPNFVLSLSALL